MSPLSTVSLQRKSLPISFLSVTSWVAKQPVQFFCSSLGETPSSPSPQRLPHQATSCSSWENPGFLPILCTPARCSKASSSLPLCAHLPLSRKKPSPHLSTWLCPVKDIRREGKAERQPAFFPDPQLWPFQRTQSTQANRNKHTHILHPPPPPRPHTRPLPRSEQCSWAPRATVHFSWLFLLALSCAKHARSLPRCFPITRSPISLQEPAIP